MNRRVLIVEDDRKTSNLIQIYFRKDGYRVAAAYDGNEALEMARKVHPDLIILDLMLPEIDGLEVCRTLRAESPVAIIMLTAKSTEDNKLQGLDLGADDYITKPFSPRELIARARAVLRRVKESDDESLQDVVVGDLQISFMRHQVQLKGKVVDLTPTEFKLLEILTQNPGRAFSRAQLIEMALGLDFEGFERTMDVHIMNLRRKVEPDPSRPRYIKTVFGFGYKLEVADAAT
jgi:DNA-binding response OmpR family regulator